MQIEMQAGVWGCFQLLPPYIVFLLTVRDLENQIISCCFQSLSGQAWLSGMPARGSLIPLHAQREKVGQLVILIFVNIFIIFRSDLELTVGWSWSPPSYSSLSAVTPQLSSNTSTNDVIYHYKLLASIFQN